MKSPPSPEQLSTVSPQSSLRNERDWASLVRVDADELKRRIDYATRGVLSGPPRDRPWDGD